jgi:hypothetical protein
MITSGLSQIPETWPRIPTCRPATRFPVVEFKFPVHQLCDQLVARHMSGMATNQELKTNFQDTGSALSYAASGRRF